MTESQHQIQTAWFARVWAEALPELRLLVATPNGGFRNKITASRMKAEGQRAGFPDMTLPVARGGFHGLFIELKKPAEDGKRKGALSPEQREWIEELRDEGYKVVVAYGWVEAIEAMLEYIGE